MSYDKRFYGIYQGVCTNNLDPDQEYKIKLTVPQVLGQSETDWALPCLPVTDNANHPDHNPHTPSQVAAQLTTASTTVTASDPQGGTVSVTIPALTVTAKSGASNLYHTHVASSDPLDDTVAEHTHHRTVPNIGQRVWVMFIAGDPNFPVWMGVLS
jgi:Type VI secretion system/phage-baseplate injector OB domain